MHFAFVLCFVALVGPVVGQNCTNLAPSAWPGVAGPGLAFSSVVLLWSAAVLVMGLFGIYLSKASFRKTVGWVALLIWISSACRLIWWSLELAQGNPGCIPGAESAAYVMNRLAWLTSAMSFLVLLFGWIESVHINYPISPSAFTKVFKVVLIVSVVLLFLLLVILIALAFTVCTEGPYEESCRSLYTGHILLQASLQALLAVAFLIYGLLLIKKLLPKGVKISSKEVSHRKKMSAFRIFLVMSSTFVFYTLRVFTLCYYPATGKFLPVWVFYGFTYILPETIPPILHLYIVFVLAYERHEREASSVNLKQRLLEEELPDSKMEKSSYNKERSKIEESPWKDSTKEN